MTRNHVFKMICINYKYKYYISILEKPNNGILTAVISRTLMLNLT